MGDNDVQMEFTGQTQESHTSSDDKIDLSLDDIIKLNKQEQRASRASSRANSKRAAVLKKLNQIPQQQRGHRRGAQQYQGPGRLRGFRRQRGSGRGMMSRGRGVSAMNSAAADSATTGGQFDQTTFTSRGTFRGRGRGRGRGGSLSRGSLSARGQRTTQRGGRPFVLDGGFSATRAEKLEKYQKIRSRRTEPSGSTLTVSLPNAKTAPVALIRAHQTGRGGAALRGRSSGGAGTTSPKGIPLHFNYRATTNQTGLSLNDRFSDLRFIGRGRGRGRGRGDIAGGGRGRGNISQSGRGRGNISQSGRGRGNISQGGRGRGNISQGGRGRGYISQGGRGRENISQGGRGRGNISQGGRGRGYISQGGRGRGNILQGGRGRGNISQGGRGRGNILQGGRGRGNILQGGRGRGGFTRGRGLTRQGRGGSRVADRTVTLQ